MSTIIFESNPNKPNRLDSTNYPDKLNNKKYHLDYARWAVSSSANSAQHNRWQDRTRTNKLFYKGDQWEFDEDKEAFLMDITGNTSSRIKMVYNIIRPLVEQFRGNASILKINATAKSISKMAVNRREMALSEKIFNTQLANEYPGLGIIMRKNDESIGENEEETTQIFENLYVDLYTAQINSLLRYVKDMNELEQMQMKTALNMALTGLSVVEPYEAGGHQRFRVVESEDFFYDTDARRNDLQDGQFMGYKHPMNVSSIVERYQPSPADARKMENYVSSTGSIDTYTDSYTGRTNKDSRLPVYKVFWRDFIKDEYGYVEDEYGYPYLTRINYTYPGEESPRYTDDDLIDPPDSPKNRKLFKKGKKKRNMFLEYVAHCTFVPGEFLGRNEENDDALKDGYDVILDYGMDEYQEVEMLDISNAKYPTKAQTWGYVDGEIFSPLDDVINPQRFINRVLSVTEQLINNSGGQGIIIDEDAIDSSTSSEEVYSDIKEGKVVTLNTKGRGVPNAFGKYDNTPSSGVYGMFEIIPAIKAMVQGMTGVNDPLQGQSTGPDQLVGVTELLIQRGSLMQEPFYSAQANLFVQTYQYTATVAKRRYIDNERELAIIAGDEGVEILTLAKDLRNEDFRVFVSRENDDAVLKSQANQMLELFLQRQLIDDKVYANLFNRSTPDDVTKALRSQAGLRAEAARQQAREQQQLAAASEEKEDQMRDEQRLDGLAVQQQQTEMQRENNASNEAKEMLKAQAQIAKNEQKSMTT
jgi:hypothetical protein